MLKLIKLIFFLFLIAVALLCAGIWWVSNNANQTLKEQIELQGSAALQTEVTVGDVNLDLRGAGIKVSDIKVANLPNYSSAYMLQTDSVSISINPKALFNKLVDVKKVTINGAEVYAEIKNNRLNLQEFSNRLNQNKNTTTSSQPNKELNDVRIRVENFSFNNGNMHLLSDKYGAADVPAPYISLSNVGGSQGLPPNELADAFLQPIIEQLKSAAKKLIFEQLEQKVKFQLEAQKKKAAAILKEKEAKLKNKYEAEIKSKEDELKDSLKEKEDEIKNKIEDKLKGLF